MFVDHVKLYVSSGSGGNGCKSFRREKFVPYGGPDGGDGGNGGDVVCIVEPHMATLLDHRYQQHASAGRGEHGKGKNRTGSNGEDYTLKVPAGTVIKDARSGDILFDLTELGDRVVIAPGGRGGRGNARFATPTDRAPERAVSYPQALGCGQFRSLWAPGRPAHLDGSDSFSRRGWPALPRCFLQPSGR